MNWDRVVTAAVSGILTALAGALGFRAVTADAPPTVPRDQCAAVIRELAGVQAETRTEADRWACKYRRAAGEGVARGWEKPTTRRAWDAICLPGEEDGP